VRVWLGEVRGWKLEVGATYQTQDGAKGVVRAVNPLENIRATWQPQGWTAPSTIQVRVFPSGRKTVISFHQEHLGDAQMREQMRNRWKNALDDLEAVVKRSIKSSQGPTKA
jgi:uncharacterized protein YndB with AHSA1/START domain